MTLSAHDQRTLRLFVAIELGEPVLQALERVQADLRRHGLQALRWVRPEGVHLTLKFLGETSERRLPAIKDALARAVEGVPPHTLSLDGLGTFGASRSPRVLWVGVAGQLEPLGRLQRQIDAALAAIGFAPEDRPFSPHLTLARVRPETARDLSGPIGRALNEVPAPMAEIPVREVSLMRSTLASGGAVYDRLATFPLG